MLQKIAGLLVLLCTPGFAASGECTGGIACLKTGLEKKWTSDKAGVLRIVDAHIARVKADSQCKEPAAITELAGLMGRAVKLGELMEHLSDEFDNLFLQKPSCVMQALGEADRDARQVAALELCASFQGPETDARISAALAQLKDTEKTKSVLEQVRKCQAEVKTKKERAEGPL